eukprot:1927455-Rhodomonas_salina.1
MPGTAGNDLPYAHTRYPYTRCEHEVLRALCSYALPMHCLVLTAYATYYQSPFLGEVFRISAETLQSALDFGVQASLKAEISAQADGFSKDLLKFLSANGMATREALSVIKARNIRNVCTAHSNTKDLEGFRSEIKDAGGERPC